MSRRQSPKDLHLSTVPLKPRHQRRIADEVHVELSPIRWTPELDEEVAQLLAKALLRDLDQYPVRESRKAS